MTLSDFEMRSLEEISADVQRSDPRLARALARGTVRPKGVDIATVVMGAALLILICVGIVCRLPVVCAVGWTAVIGLTTARGMVAGDGP